MTRKESSPNDDSLAIREDAEDCAQKLAFLLIARNASATSGIHRANALATYRIYSAIKFYRDGETLESIGQVLGKDRRVISRYNERFISWSGNHCEQILKGVTPYSLIEVCKRLFPKPASLADILDELRIALAELLDDLVCAAGDISNHEDEVFGDLRPLKNYPTISAVLNAF